MIAPNNSWPYQFLSIPESKIETFLLLRRAKRCWICRNGGRLEDSLLHPAFQRRRRRVRARLGSRATRSSGSSLVHRLRSFLLLGSFAEEQGDGGGPGCGTEIVTDGVRSVGVSFQYVIDPKLAADVQLQEERFQVRE